MKRISIIGFLVTATLLCMMSCSKIKIDPSIIVVDSSRQTVELKVNREIRMFDVCAGVVKDLSRPEFAEPIEKDYYEDEGDLKVSRHIVGDWCHVEGDMFTKVIYVHLDENQSSESRSIAIDIDETRYSRIIQEGIENPDEQ